MANEFIIKKGFISKANSQVTGSLNVSGSLNVNGSPVGASATNLTQSLFVSPSGDNATAVVGDLHKPFQTILAATASANIGDTTTTLKCDSDPAGTLWLLLSLITSRCKGLKSFANFFSIVVCTIILITYLSFLESLSCSCSCSCSEC